MKQQTKSGLHNEGKENRSGYCQAVSGLCDMTNEYDRMFTAEGKYWMQYKHENPDLWKAKLRRLEHTRGTVFITRLVKCIKWWERKQ